MTNDAPPTPATLEDVIAALGELTVALRPALTPATRPTWEQQRWAPGADAFGTEVVAPTAAVDPSGFPGHVAPDELIESAWGNAVVDHLKFYAAGAMEYPVALTASSAGWRVAYTVAVPTLTFATVMTATGWVGWAGDQVAIRAGTRLTRLTDANPGVQMDPHTMAVGDWGSNTHTREWPVAANGPAGYTFDLNVVGVVSGAIYVAGQTTWSRRLP
jgi:hypothetical protein